MLKTKIERDNILKEITILKVNFRKPKLKLKLKLRKLSIMPMILSKMKKKRVSEIKKQVATLSIEIEKLIKENFQR